MGRGHGVFKLRLGLRPNEAEKKIHQSGLTSAFMKVFLFIQRSEIAEIRQLIGLSQQGVSRS